MPSRYLLIEFDDAESADALKQRIDATGGKKFRVIGLFAKPTAYCQCPLDGQTETKASPAKIKRGKKFGWWVCTECRRPTSSLSGLVNLLKPRDIIDSPTWEAPDTNRGITKWTHYIPSLSGLALGEPGRRFWNER